MERYQNMKNKRASTMVSDETMTWLLYIFILIAIGLAVYAIFKGVI